MIQINLPKTPVDGYQVKYWRLSLSQHWCYIKEMVATYYVNTPWSVYSPDTKDRGGAPLVDDWMISEGRVGIGRFCGWDSIKTLTTQKDIFPSREAAIIEALIKLDEYIMQAENLLRALKAKKEEISKS
jgi:hypothetical protein